MIMHPAHRFPEHTRRAGCPFRQDHKQTIEQAVELATPIAVSLSNFSTVTALLWIKSISSFSERHPVEAKDGEANQKYVLSSHPGLSFIIRQALDLGERLLIPMIDFSQGDAAAIKSFTAVGIKMGFTARQRKAAQAGTEAQRKFEADRRTLGSQLLKKHS